MTDYLLALAGAALSILFDWAIFTQVRDHFWRGWENANQFRYPDGSIIRKAIMAILGGAILLSNEVGVIGATELPLVLWMVFHGLIYWEASRFQPKP